MQHTTKQYKGSPPSNHNHILITLSVNIYANGILNCSTQICSTDSCTLPRATQPSDPTLQPGTPDLAEHLQGETGREPARVPGRRPEERCGRVQPAERALCTCIPRRSERDQKPAIGIKKDLKTGRDCKG